MQIVSKCMKCQSLFSGKYKKKYLNMSPAVVVVVVVIVEDTSVG